MHFDHIDWNRAFFKTYYKKQSFGHLLINFNHIWVIHILLFWFYTAYNALTIFQPKQGHSSALTWSVTALGGVVATVIVILATLAKFLYIPTTWNNTSHITHRLLFLLVTLALTASPTVYIAIMENQGSSGGSIALILSIAQFFISIGTTLLFGIMPSGQMFGDRVASTSRKYLASQTFTTSYPILHSQVHLGSVFLWFLVFGCKFTELYFFLTLAFCNSSHEKLFGNTLRQSCHFYPYNHILPGHIPVVYHLEYCLLHPSFLHASSLNLDNLKGYLRSIAKTHIFQDSHDL